MSTQHSARQCPAARQVLGKPMVLEVEPAEVLEAVREVGHDAVHLGRCCVKGLIYDRDDISALLPEGNLKGLVGGQTLGLVNNPLRRGESSVPLLVVPMGLVVWGVAEESVLGLGLETLRPLRFVKRHLQI